MTQLERDTAAYYKNMSEEEAIAERELEKAIAEAAPRFVEDREEQQECCGAAFQISVTEK
jgi:hypothetical protein